MTGWIEALGQFLGRSAETTGYGLVLLARTVLNLPHLLHRRRMRDCLNLMFTYTLGSFTVTAVVALFTGMILALNGGDSLASLGQENLIGRIVAISMIREMGPFMTALILTASLGSGIAAEIGTMKISEEIDALEIMSISPIRFLVLPRLVALTLVTPVMTIFAAFIGILGASIVAANNFGVTWIAFSNDALVIISILDVDRKGKGALLGGPQQRHVLINLVGHTAGARNLVSMYRPAPVQALHYGYPASTGLSTVLTWTHRATSSLQNHTTTASA